MQLILPLSPDVYLAMNLYESLWHGQDAIIEYYNENDPDTFG